jgi:hypothetical protein
MAMKPVGAFVECFSFTTRCCYSMVRALSAVIVMAVSVSGSYLTNVLVFLWTRGIRGRSRRTETSLGSITSVRREAFAWIVPQGPRRILKPPPASMLHPIRALRRV